MELSIEEKLRREMMHEFKILRNDLAEAERLLAEAEDTFSVMGESLFAAEIREFLNRSKEQS